VRTTTRLIELQNAVSQYREAVEALELIVRSEFPVGSVVRATHVGQWFGVVVNRDDCPPDQVALMFENGNVRFKPITLFERVPYSRRAWPEWVCMYKLSLLPNRRGRFGSWRTCGDFCIPQPPTEGE
jgi:hypothetical protein